MSKKNEAVVIAEDFLKKGDECVKENKLDEAILNYTFVSKYAKMVGNFDLAAYGYMKQFKVLIKKKNFSNVALQSSLALDCAQKSKDPNLKREFIDLFNSIPELKTQVADHNAMWNNLLQGNRYEKRIINLKMRDNYGDQISKQVELIGVNSIKEEYLYLFSTKCDKCQSLRSWNPPNQALLVGISSGKLQQIDQLVTSCSKCNNRLELYFDINSFIWNNYPEKLTEEEKLEKMNLKNVNEGEFIIASGYNPGSNKKPSLKCPKCGAQVKNIENKFCGNCGNPLK